MENELPKGGSYPLLEELLRAQCLPLKGTWTIGDVAALFNVRKRAIYDWISVGKLQSRDLPGRGRFLSADLEQFLRDSKRPRRTGAKGGGRR